MEKARRPMFQQELEELRSKVSLSGYQETSCMYASSSQIHTHVTSQCESVHVKTDDKEIWRWDAGNNKDKYFELSTMPDHDLGT